jgi:hypothetical protein
VSGQETREQPDENDVLVDLLARSIAAESETPSNAGLGSRAGGVDEDVWACSLWADGQ